MKSLQSFLSPWNFSIWLEFFFHQVRVCVYTRIRIRIVYVVANTLHGTLRAIYLNGSTQSLSNWSSYICLCTKTKNIKSHQSRHRTHILTQCMHWLKHHTNYTLVCTHVYILSYCINCIMIKSVFIRLYDDQFEKFWIPTIWERGSYFFTPLPTPTDAHHPAHSLISNYLTVVCLFMHLVV